MKASKDMGTKDLKIFVTTREYYSLSVPADDMIEVTHERMSSFADKINAIRQEIEEAQTLTNDALAENKRASALDFEPFDNPTDEELDDLGDAVECNESPKPPTEVTLSISDTFKHLFMDGGSAEDVRSYKGYWDNWDSKLYLKRIVQKQDDQSVTVIVAPCFPTDFVSSNYRIRHEYLRMLFGELLSPDVFLIAHDKDLYKDSNERCLTEDDCKNGGNILNGYRIPLGQIFGFQHLNERNHVFSIFVKKLSELTVEDCREAIKVIESDKKNREKYTEIDNYPFSSKGAFKDDGKAEDIRKLIDEIIV